MKKLAIFSLCLGCVFAVCTSHAIDLKQSKVTQVVNDVEIISAASQAPKTAAVNDTFSIPDILRTGNASRAELVAADATVTRVGANTIFSFDPARRTIDLKQGSLLFHAPHGKGGGSIHTGSATASVLGTTLIVTTTPNGGFKVLALEGEVEVKFLNGLKQKLDPGQMTFVLPGANQLAPVIIFRLDELTANSLLVRGFSDSLDSMPLIQQQIEKQLKLIQSGRATDTGLYAGDDASPNQVEVLDINTISHSQHNEQPHTPNPPPPPPPGSSLAKAEAADATINQPSLTDASIPTPPLHVFAKIKFGVPGNPFFGGQRFSGFIARNITVNSIGADPLLVDLSPYSKLSIFALVALGDFSFAGSTTFEGLPASASLALIAGGEFNFTPGTALRADVHDFKFFSPATLTLDNVSFYNLANDLTLISGGDANVQNGSLLYANGKLTINVTGVIAFNSATAIADSAVFTALSGSIALDNTEMEVAHQAILIGPGIRLNNASINADSLVMSGTGSGTIIINDSRLHATSQITVVSPNDLDINGASAVPTARLTDKVSSAAGSSLTADPASGSVTLVSTFGSVNVNNTSITAHYLTLNSGDGILLDASGHAITASGAGATANFTAPNLVAVNHADLSSFATVNMAANTINLYDVAFGGTVSLKSTSGIWNNGSVMPGAVNDLGAVTYNGVLVNAPNGSTGLLPGTGITVGAR